MGTDPAGGSFIGLRLGRKLASLPQSGSIDGARRVIDAARSSVVEHGLATPGAPSLATTARGITAQTFAGALAPAEASHIIAQVERVLDADVLTKNRATAEAAAAAQSVTTKGNPMSNITGASQLGYSAASRIASAKTKIAAANEKLAGAFSSMDNATLLIEDVATKVEQEAADLTSATAQLTNGG